MLARCRLAGVNRFHWEDNRDQDSTSEVHRVRRSRGWRLMAFAAPASAADVGACLITKTDTNPFFVKMKEGATAKAKELGVDAEGLCRQDRRRQ